MAEPAYLQAEWWSTSRGWSKRFVFVWSCCSVER